MSKSLHILFFLLFFCFSMPAQEILQASKIQAKGGRKNMPPLGLPVRTDGGIDNIVRYNDGRWEGAESADASPKWTMLSLKTEIPVMQESLGAIVKFCRAWALEKPKGKLDIVYGSCKGGWFVAVCKKTRSNLGWKSIAFLIPSAGFEKDRSIYHYSHSVNWLEYQIGYNLYPKLPSHIQEIIEEMTATELLSIYQESDSGLDDRPENEIDYDWESDYRDMW